ncbi:hypothetical protein KFE25_004189, partial [Diacronema lutheri]
MGDHLTYAQRERVRGMLKDGIALKAIAEETGVPVDVIESDVMPPKRAQSAYYHFSAAKRAEVTRALGDGASSNDVARALGARWQEVDSEERAPYEALADTDRARYARELSAHEARLSAEAEAEAERAKRERSGPSERDAERAEKRARLAEEVEERAAAPKLARAPKERTADEARLDAQNASIERDKRTAADARLRFLFSQSDLFKHFGFAAEAPAGMGKGAGKKGRGRGRMTEKEEDDQA